MTWPRRAAISSLVVLALGLGLLATKYGRSPQPTAAVHRTEQPQEQVALPSALSPVEEPTAESSTVERQELVTPAVDTPPNIPEADAEFKRRTFKELLDQFDGVPLERTDWPGFTPQQLCPMLMVMSVAAVMDAAGTSWESPRDGVRRDVFESGKWDHAFSYNNREYRFRRGDFPVYDEYADLAKSEAARQEAHRLEQARSTTPSLVPLPDMPYPPDFMQRASAFGHSALALRP